MKYLLCLILAGCAASAPNAGELVKTGGDLTSCDGVGFDARAKAGGATPAGNAAGWAAYDACMHEKGFR